MRWNKRVVARVLVKAEALEPRLLLAGTPFTTNGLPWAIGPSGISWVEAEDFDLGGEGFGYHDTSTANQGGKYRLSEGVDIEGPATATEGTYNTGYTNAGEWMDYTINVAVGGSYQVTVRASNANAAAATARVNIGAVSTGSMTISPTGGWGNYQSFTATVTLASGTQVMRITDEAGGYNLDYLALQPTSTLGGEQPYGARGLPPLIAVGGELRVQAENYNTGGEGVAYHRSAATKSSTATLNGQPFRPLDLVSTSNGGTGIYTSYWKSGDWTQYIVNVTQAGTYEMLFNYARGDANNSNISVAVNGTTQLSNVALPSTGGWANWVNVGGTLTLAEGRNVVRFTTGIGQINFDYFRLISSSTFGNGGASWYIAGTGSATRIEAENFDTDAGAYSDTTSGNSGNSNYRAGTDVDLSVTTDSSGAVQVGDFAAGEYLDYTVRPNSTSDYVASVRVQSATGGQLQVQFDAGGGFGAGNTGVLTFNIPVSATAGWQTVNVPVRFKAGLQTMRLKAVTGGVAVNWIELAANPNAVVVKPDVTELGSYAATPPQAALDGVSDLFDRVYTKQYDWVNRPAGAAIPTNDWWTQILESTFAASLWAYPAKVGNTTAGSAVTAYSSLNITAGNVGVTGGTTVTVGDAAGNVFTRDALLDYGDWTVQYRMLQAGSNYMDVTIGRGLPYTWYEFSGMTPTLTVGTGATAYGPTGAALGSTFTADRFRVASGANQFGIYAPAGTTFTLSAGKYTVNFSGAEKYLVVAVLPDATDATFDLYYQHAYAIPREVGSTPSSAFTFDYSATAGRVTTTWTLNTVALKAGASTDTIQGWLPQDYEGMATSPPLVSGLSYASVKGTVRVSVGKTFVLGQENKGIAYLLANPLAIGGLSDYSITVMKNYIQTYVNSQRNAAASTAAGKTILNYGGDTYWGGKDPQTFAEYALMAKQVGDTVNYAILLDNLRMCLTDWMTYTPGEDQHYFAYYPGTQALIGFDPSYGSQNFTDIMFHAGYFTSSAGVLAILDPAWGAQYGDMVKMVAKTYANWERPTNTNDVTSLPYFRSFEFWAGHSYAGGTGDARGNNQESTSESIQSWLGLALLGQALNDSAMTAAGMMGYTRESKAVQYQWFDYKQQSFAVEGSGFNRSNVAINYDDSKAYATFFGANPEYILGIEALPLWPSLDYLGQYPTVAAQATAKMLAQRAIYYNDPTKNTFASFETGTGSNDWLNITLGYQALYNPQATADEFARMLSENTPTSRDGDTGLYYYQTHAYRTYGLRDYGYHLSMPIGGVYSHGADGTSMSNTRTYMVYNPGAQAATVYVYDESGSVVDSFVAAAGTDTVVTRGLVGATPPVIASVTSTAATATTVALSAVASDDGGEGSLSYLWAATGPASVAFSTNGNNAAKNTTATFTKAGTYNFVVKVTDGGGLSATANLSVVVSQQLTLAVAGLGGASTNTSQSVTAVGIDQFGAAITSGVTYTWTATGPAGVSFSPNGSTASNNATATFAGAGAYRLWVAASAAGAATVEGYVDTNVAQVLTAVTVTPASVSVAVGATQPFSATGLDQFGAALLSQPVFAWSMVSGVGSINGTTGVYQAPASPGAGQVRATSGSVSGTASVSVVTVSLGIFTQDGDVGSTGAAGSGFFDSTGGVYTLNGAGSDIAGTADGFHFTYTANSGDATFQARVGSITNTHVGAKAGVMFRESTAANARTVFVVATPGSGVTFGWRTSTGGTIGTATVAGIVAPVWVKLVRAGNGFTAFYATTTATPGAADWKQIGGGKIVSMGSTALAGLAVTSHVSGTLSTGTFSNVLLGRLPAAPTGLKPRRVSGAAELTWTSKSSNELGFIVEWSLNSTTWTTLAAVPASTGPDSQVVYVSPVYKGLRYFRVRAYNQIGDSPYSNVASMLL